jgi:hypothetical protein
MFCIKLRSGVHKMLHRLLMFESTVFDQSEIFCAGAMCCMKFCCQNTKWWDLTLNDVVLLPFQKLTLLSGSYFLWQFKYGCVVYNEYHRMFCIFIPCHFLSQHMQ